MKTTEPGKVSKAWSLIKTAAARGALAELPEYALYHSPVRRSWKKLRGLDFHRSTVVWYAAGAEAHTRLTLLLPRLVHDFPGIKKVDLQFELYDRDGRLAARRRLADVGVAKPFVIDSAAPPAELGLPKEFDGSLSVMLRLHLDEDAIAKRSGLFGSTHTYLDYYREGDFVATLHDYCAYLPDQALQTGKLGMIPAYADDARETFLVFHASRNGIGPKDLEVSLVNAEGRKFTVPLPHVARHGTKRIFLTELFPAAREFLGGKTGHVMVRGLFRCLLRRIAYGVYDRPTRTFSYDHCYYSPLENKTFYPAADRARIGKGWFNPLIVLEDDRTTTSVIVFHAAEETGAKTFGCLLYDAAGALVAEDPLAVRLAGDGVGRIDFRDVLVRSGTRTPFLGHAEIYYPEDPSRESYERDLDVNAEYRRDGKCANVIFGSDVWNAPVAVPNKKYRSVCRVVCDARHTTLIGITNCSYDRAYALEVPYTISLVGGDQVLATRKFTIGPNATTLKAVDEIFPDARALLEPTGGIGFTATTDINVSCLTHLFFTQDRKSGALSVEHSLDA